MLIIGIQLDTTTKWKNSDFFRLIASEVSCRNTKHIWTDQELDQMEYLPAMTGYTWHKDIKSISGAADYSKYRVYLKDFDLGSIVFNPSKKMFVIEFDQIPLPIIDREPYLIKNPLTKISDAINYIKKLAKEGRIAPEHIPKKFDLVCFND